MRWIGYILTIVALFIVFFIVKMERGKIVKLCGIGLIATPIIIISVDVLILYVLKLLGKTEIMQDIGEYSKILIMVLMGFCFVNLGNLCASLLVDFVLEFHKRYNRANLNREPLKFAVNNQSVISNIFTWIFFISSILVFYGIWFLTKF